MNDFKLRTESLKDDEILKFAIKNSNDEKKDAKPVIGSLFLNKK